MATYNVQPETNKIIKEYAERIGKEPEEALDRLIQTAASRKASLQKYQQKEKAAPKAKKGKAAKGTSLAKKKAAPKAKRAPKAKQVRAIDVVSGDDQPV